MGGSPSKPEGTPLECILKKWKNFKIGGLRKERLKFYCNTVWPLYRLRDGKKWPEIGSLSYDTILQLDLYCHKNGKWTEAPYVQAFMVLYQNPSLCRSCNQKPGKSENTLDILDDPVLTFPNSQGETKPPLLFQSHLLLQIPLTRPNLHLPMSLYIFHYPTKERLVPLG